jgi:hypothetical protein
VRIFHWIYRCFANIIDAPNALCLECPRKENTMPAQLQQSGAAHMAVASPPASLQTLKPHQAIGFRPTQASVLRVLQGRVWVTTGCRQGLAGEPDSGDVVLGAGQHLALAAGSHVVVESWPTGDGDATQVSVAAVLAGHQAVSLGACATPARSPMLKPFLPARRSWLKPAV